MKYIKDRNIEPKELTEYRENTPGASYDSFRSKEIIKRSLLDEQGYICAYCMGSLKTVERCSIEHFISQSRHPLSPYPPEFHQQQSLLYSNMSAVCINSGDHCDKKRGNVPLLFLDPHSPLCEQYITYSLDAEIIPQGENKEMVEGEINTLGLNCTKLKKLRQAVWEEILDRFRQECTKEKWTKELLLEQAQKYRNKEKKRGNIYRYHAYCDYIVWCFEYYANNLRK